MKPIPQNILVIIGCIVIAIVILGVFGFYSTKAPLQRQAIHVFDAPNLKITDSNGRIKISETKPNSMYSFYYPDPDRYKNRDPYDLFILIRLPDYLGGTANDASAFRAYSAIDPSSHCIVKYWPQEDRRRMEDPCGGNFYEPVSGYATAFGRPSILVPKNLALPYLSLSSDENGFLYVEPPTFTEEKNGAIGIGRTVSEQEIKAVNQLNKAREEQFQDAVKAFMLPYRLSTGHILAGTNYDGVRTSSAEYVNEDSDSESIFLYYEYCNCTKSQEILADEEMTRTDSQLLQAYGIPVVAYPNAKDYVSGIHDKYVYVFYDDGYKMTLHTNQKLDSKLTLVRELLDFDND